jgi:hypothetical protein
LAVVQFEHHPNSGIIRKHVQAHIFAAALKRLAILRRNVIAAQILIFNPAFTE